MLDSSSFLSSLFLLLFSLSERLISSSLISFFWKLCLEHFAAVVVFPCCAHLQAATIADSAMLLVYRWCLEGNSGGFGSDSCTIALRARLI